MTQGAQFIEHGVFLCEGQPPYFRKTLDLRSFVQKVPAQGLLTHDLEDVKCLDSGYALNQLAASKGWRSLHQMAVRPSIVRAP
jgi:hypothetical protein